MNDIVNIFPYLLVSDGLTAIEHYKKIFNAELIEHRPFPPEMGKQMGYPADYDFSKSTMHASLRIGGERIDLADNNQNTVDQGHVEITIEFDTETHLTESYNKALADGGQSPMQIMRFPGLVFARVIDKFGVGWQLNYITGE